MIKKTVLTPAAVRRLKWMVCCLGVAVMAACGDSGESPKPQAYLRIDLPPHRYAVCDTAALPFTFEKSALANVEWKKDVPGEKWFTITYPKYKGYVFMTYKRMNGVRRGIFPTRRASMKTVLWTRRTAFPAPRTT